MIVEISGTVVKGKTLLKVWMVEWMLLVVELNFADLRASG